MKIESSDVKMSAQTKSTLEMSYKSEFSFQHEILGLVNAQEVSDKSEVNAVESAKNEEESPYQVNPYQAAITKLILELILQRFLGGNKKVKFDLPKSCENMSAPQEAEPKKLLVHSKATIQQSVEYNRSDSIAFKTQAVIKTADKDINIDLDIAYSKAFYEKHSETLEFEETRFMDPLVIQYDCKSSAFDSVSETMCFNFDINSNGTQEELPLLKDGSGFLAWDRDLNGSIDNGSELFGPQTNDAFAELRAYDSDGNNWIDENDPIFDDLRIWTKNESGEDALIALGQSGVGALYLNDIASEMNYHKSVNENIAQLKSSSVFLREDGTAGVLSALNFVA